ncbi:hypothetical protein [Nitrososphaera sp.]|uniref:hypothetical protein n=1 Tax=Nitrososphaera sp. TaxID=1971748 RepID=UPI0031777478
MSNDTGILEVFAQPSANMLPKFVDANGNSLNFMFHYVSLLHPETSTLRLSVNDPNGLNGVSASKVSGSRLVSVNRLHASGSVDVHLDTSGISGSADAFPMYFGTVVQASDGSGSSNIEILFVVFKDEIPGPVITFDRDEYLPHETMTVTVKDIRANRNPDPNFSDEIKIRVISMAQSMIQSAIASGSGTMITLKEVTKNEDPLVTPGVFRGKIPLNGIATSANGGISYNPVTAVYADMVGNQAIKSVSVSSFGIRLDKERYFQGDNVKVTVYQPQNDPSVAISWTKFVSGLLSLNKQAAGTYTGAFNLMDIGKPGIYVPEGGDISLSYLGKTALAKVVGKPSIKFNKASYGWNERAKLTVIDHNANKDPFKADIVTAKVYSTSNAAGFDIQLIEKGTNSGVFHGMYYLGFSTSGSYPVSSIIQVSSVGTSMVTARYVWAPNLILQTSTSVGRPSEQSDPSAGAFTDEPSAPTGIPPLEGTFVYPVPANIDCSSYGEDIESDGICDGWEGPTWYHLTIPYGAEWHQFRELCNLTECATKQHKDIIVEIDWLLNNDPDPNVIAALNPDGYEPDINDSYVFGRIKTIFETYGQPWGYRIHFLKSEGVTPDVARDQNGAPRYNTINVWRDPSYDETPCNTAKNPDGTYVSNDGCQSFQEIKWKYFGKNDGDRSNNDRVYALWQVAHYVLYGKYAKMHHEPKSSGMAETVGNDMLVTLGPFVYDADKAKGSIMHELGHNLGLEHGGGPILVDQTLRWNDDRNVNCKPNYLSVMTYGRQMKPEWSGDAGDLYSYYIVNPNPLYMNNLNEPAGMSPDRQGVFDEKTLYGFPSGGVVRQAAKGLTYGSDPAVNWNGVNGAGETGLNIDIVNVGIPGCQEPNALLARTTAANKLYSTNDWERMFMNFRALNPSAFASGAYAGGHNDLTNATYYKILEVGIKMSASEIEVVNDDDFTDHGAKAQLVDILTGPHESAVTYLESKEIDNAIRRLLEVRQAVDGDVGGDPHDDKITDSAARRVVYEVLDMVIRTIAREYSDGMFALMSHNVENFVIVGTSSTVDAASHKFTIEQNVGIKGIRLVGDGDVELKIPWNSMPVGQKLDKNATTLLIDGVPVNDVDWDVNDSDNSFYNTVVRFRLSDDHSPNAERLPSPDGRRIYSVQILSANIVPEFPLVTILMLAATMAAAIGTSVLWRGRMSGGI